MKRRLRILAGVCALLLLAAGCGKITPHTGESQPIAIVTSVPEGYVEKTASPVPESTPIPDATAEEDFLALDREVFIRYITDDGYSFHQMLTDPAAFGLSSESVAMTLGEFTEEHTEAYGRECAAYLERLLAIPRSELSVRSQLSYDILEQYLEDASADNIYAYYYEPLTEYSGLHSSIPLALGLFKIRSEQDVKDYLLLLEDVPRYLNQVLAYEQKRAQMGLFMTEDALDAILEACDEIISARDSFYLIGTFNDAVDGIASLDTETASVYKARSEAAVKGPFMDAYKALYDGLAALRSSCRQPGGLCTLGKTGAAYFEYAMQREGDNRLSAEETLELIKSELFYDLAMFIECYQAHPEALEGDGRMTSGNVQTDIDQLESITNELLFTLPEHTLSITAIPEEFENQMSGAAYVIPPIDDWMDNEILINPSYADNQQLTTLAHEGYPGHMFQYVYQRSLSDTGLMQRALHYGAHAEGWSQTAEYLVATTQTVYNTALSEMNFYNNMILNVLLPGIVSIYVNYYDYNKDAVKAFMTGLNIGAEEYADVYYAMAVEQPLYIFNYATGYCQLAKLMRDAEETLGSSYDRKAFLKAYLDLGPGYFNLLQERMDVWIDENTPE